MKQTKLPKEQIRFGAFDLDLGTGELRKSGVKLKLQEQAFQILRVLLENPGEVVTREELQKRIWSADTFVDFDHGLDSAMTKLREALGDSSKKPRFMETLPRRGYRFIASVQTIPPTETHLLPVHLRFARKVVESLAVLPFGLIVTGVAVAVLVLVAGGGYFYFHRAPILTDKDSIVLADFTNTTGDPVFEGTLRQGLSAQLEQSPFFHIISGDQIAQTLRMMEKPPDARLTSAVAREICQRANATTEIEGSIAALENQYVLGLSAINCATGETLVQEQVTADGKTKVLPALSGAASVLRSKLGESRASLQQYDVPLERATTSSLEALRAYTLGTQALVQGDSGSAISSYERAVSLDPNFALAYSNLGIGYDMAGEEDLAAEYTSKAYDLRDRASEREKFSIISNYHIFATGDMEKAAQISKQWTKTFPRDPVAFMALNGADTFLPRLDEALVAAREVLQLDPNPSPSVYRSVVMAYSHLGRWDEARTTIQQAEANHIDPAAFRDMLYAIAALQNDSAAMDRQLTGPWIFQPPAYADALQSMAAAYYGHLAHARELRERAVASAREQGANNSAALYRVSGALTEALFGNLPEAKRALKDAGDLSAVDRDLEADAAIVWALAGDTTLAQKLADDLNKRFPQATYIRFGALPATQSLLALHRAKPGEATEALRVVSSHELARSDSPLSVLVPAYVRGDTYLAAHQGPQAAAEFQRILDHRGFVWVSPTGALAHLGLGRAYALTGDTAKAKTAYQDFLALWKDADPDIPILKEAKAEYAKLQ